MKVILMIGAYCAVKLFDAAAKMTAGAAVGALWKNRREIFAFGATPHGLLITAGTLKLTLVLLLIGLGGGASTPQQLEFQAAEGFFVLALGVAMWPAPERDKRQRLVN